MFRRSKKAFSLFVACVMILSLVGQLVEAAVATISTGNPGKIVDVTIRYDSQSSVKIDTVVLYIDNIVYQKKKLPNPAKQGVVTFDWNTQAFARGQHYIEARLYSNNKLVTAVNGAGIVADSIFDVNPPKVALPGMKDGEVVSGTKVIRIDAKDDSGEAPIVSLLVDKKLKLMQNTQPYSYNLDTTALSDGKHTVEVYAFDLEGNQSDIVSYEIIVNNGNAPVETSVAKVETVKTTPIDLGTPKSDNSISTRPTLSNTTNVSVGRISDSEVSASVSTVKSAPVIATNNEGILSPSKVLVNQSGLNTPKVANTLVAKNNANAITTNNSLKLSVNSKCVNDINTPKTAAVEPAPIQIAKRVSDNNVVNNELKLVTTSNTADLVLNTPKTVATPAEPKTVTTPAAPKTVATPKAEVKAEAKPEANVVVAKSNANNSVAVNSELKLASNSTAASYDINTPNVKNNVVVKTPEAKPVVKTTEKPVVKTTEKPVQMAMASPAKATPSLRSAYVASGKAKLRDLVNADNGTLLWDHKTKTVTAYVNNCKVEMTIGSKKAKVNGNPVVVNLVPTIKNGRTIIDVTEFNRILNTPSLKK